MSDKPKAEGECFERWSVRRWKQLEKLERLLIECESLNAGNCILQRIRKLIDGAEKLRAWDREGRKQSFMQFLRELARHDYESRKRKRKSSPGANP